MIGYVRSHRIVRAGALLGRVAQRPAPYLTWDAIRPFRAGGEIATGLPRRHDAVKWLEAHA